MGETLFTTTIDKTHRILHEIEDSLGWPRDRRQQSYAAMRYVLHALRDRLTVEEAAQLGAQLPMLVSAGEWVDVLAALPQDLVALAQEQEHR